MPTFKKVLVTSVLTSVIVLASAIPAEASGLTQAQINAIIGVLQSFNADPSAIANVRNILNGGSGGFCHSFSSNLTMGMRSTEVTALQQALIAQGVSIPAGATGYFGLQTKAAVVIFQQKYANEILTPNGLRFGTGFVGASTRAKLNTLFVCRSAATTPIIYYGGGGGSSHGSGGGGGGGGGSVTPATPAPSCTLATSPSSITVGSYSTLSWTTSNATSFSISADGQTNGASGATGSTLVTPQTTTTYTGTVTGSGGTATCTATVTVTPRVSQQSPACSLSLTPPSVTTGGYATLSWTTSHATSFTVSSPGATNTMSPVASGSTLVNPQTTTTYTGTASSASASGVGTCSATLTVTPVVSAAPSCTLSVSPSSLTVGGYATLSWTTLHAALFTVSADGQTNNMTPVASGSTLVKPQVTTTYTGTASSPGSSGTGSCSSTITVAAAPVVVSSNPYDYNDSHTIDGSDLTTLRAVALRERSCPTRKICDLSGDSAIDYHDITALTTFITQRDYTLDNIVSGSDVVALQEFISSGESCPLGKVCDINHDGSVNTADLIALNNLL